MSRVSVSFEVEIGDEGHSYEEICEWICFCLGARGDIAANNPLCNKDLNAEYYSVEVDM